ncbi:uncharacterized protein BDV17DRAFT_284525 [Aspergillus undulatus]|uniref:uncharacterized protein n=1 Tax=Aspergillus undulatus TaxID=1810928 RepID=UPI003CCDDA08
MDPKTNGIEDFPAHWKATLLGDEFWKDAEDWNKNTNDKIEAGNLHTRFPFNIGPEQTPRAPSIITTAADSEETAEVEIEIVAPERRSRRFSMSDALNPNSITGRSSSSLFPTSRVLDLGARLSRSRSRSPSKSRIRASSVTADVRRSNSMIRSTFNRLSGRGKKRDKDEEEDATGVGEELELELEVQEEEEPVPYILPYTPDQATPANPLMEFRGGMLWTALPKDRRTLGFDVFWPVPLPAYKTTDERATETDRKSENKGSREENDKQQDEAEEEEDPAIFPLDNMAPLCMFRNLRVLKITGMMQSYQMYIFQAAWLNPNLEELELGMALPPRLRRAYKWPYIKGGWRLDKTTYAEPVYYGTGYGSLHHKIGCAEYLDKVAVEKSKIKAMAMGETRNRLSIRTLILTGFVVDADPFLHWFDPKRLKSINFKDNCVDAGFYLPYCMRKVSVLFPRQIAEQVGRGRVVDVKRQLKVVRLERRRKVREVVYHVRGTLGEEILRNRLRNDMGIMGRQSVE